ncbi:hypothetical protein B0A52_09079 [Exophiala mesophila]|uniref:Uracil catabolism protein 4 n=1 Tax=Exophiala mesophila TaxID=212818 RepID=A0A438MTD0_EXOME|nr:hypothetical protein B0A52_09079 [Exophiala mesophila]
MDSDIDYLLSLAAVRDRANVVLDLAEKGKLNHFNYEPKNLDVVADYVSNLITRDFGPDRYNEIPPHGRWQHFNVGGVDRVATLLGETGSTDKTEQARILIDLFVVSVLLDAGAGATWRFLEPVAGTYSNRSEGIAVASLYMFKAGAFSSDSSKPYSVSAQGLKDLSTSEFKKHFQISESNPMIGVEARVQLLREVGNSLLQLPKVFGEQGRPGNLVDYLLSSSEGGILKYSQLWSVLQSLLIPAWPKTRTHVNGRPIGDAWPLQALAAQSTETASTTSTIQPFHKLTQWLAYSLSVPFERVLGLKWTEMESGTGLPEYRNGGLFVDLEVLQLKPETLAAGQKASGQDLPIYGDTSDVIVEWRALTVALLDRLHGLVAGKFAKQGVSLSMAQMLEAGSWKAGRELAKAKRPETMFSPILIDGDGTLF